MHHGRGASSPPLSFSQVTIAGVSTLIQALNTSELFRWFGKKTLTHRYEICVIRLPSALET